MISPVLWAKTGAGPHPGKFLRLSAISLAISQFGLEAYSANPDGYLQGSPLVDLGCSPHML